MTLIERLYQLVPLGTLPKNVMPPATLWGFIWHFVRQIKPLIGVLMVLEAGSAFLQAMIPLLLGQTVKMVNAGTWDWPLITWGALVLVAQLPFVLMLWWFYDHVYSVQFGNMLRRQLHHYTLGHSLGYFNNDYAGRIANKVLESGPALRDGLRSTVGAVWYAAFYAGTAVIILFQLGGYLAWPTVIWLISYGLTLWLMVPRIRVRAMKHSEMHSTLVGRVVDTYTNIQTVTLFARKREEDELGYRILLEHTGTMRATNHAVWLMGSVIMVSNTLLMLSTAALAMYGWRQGTVTASLVVTALPLVWQLVNMSGWIRQEVTGIFENLGRVEECMQTISKPHQVIDKNEAVPLVVNKGDILFEDVAFHYGKSSGVIEGLNLYIKAGQKVGLVGRSGAGKSTLVNLLMRSYDLASGRIMVDGQDIAEVILQSLREQMAMVTQDSSLLNRSIRENFLLGRPGATDASIEEAARRAHAHEFILGLRDLRGNQGYEAQVGERGVKLSGGQRQRISLARVFLKDAPILILDEATSALDSEAEGAIQENLGALMAGKTVIAIAHRLSTLQIMDRIIVMDAGAVVEDGSHTELLRLNGVYAKLWQMQSGGFIRDEDI